MGGNLSSNELKEDEKVHHLRRCSPNSESEHHGVKVEGRSAVRSIQAETLKLANEYEEVRRSHIDGHTISLEDSRFFSDMENAIRLKQANLYTLKNRVSDYDEPRQWTNFVGGYLNTLSRNQKPTTCHFRMTPQLPLAVLSVKNVMAMKRHSTSSSRPPTHAPFPIKRRNSTNTVGLLMSIDEMDVRGMIYVTSLVLHHHIREGCKESREISPGFEIFSDVHLASPNDPRKPASSNCPPHADDVYKFYRHIYKTAQMEKDCIIMSLVYIERMLSEAPPALCICGSNWKSIILSGMALASKVWDDLSMLNVDFSKIGNAELHHLNMLEGATLSVLQFSVRVDASTFARYYFRLRHWCMIVGAYHASPDSRTVTDDTVRSNYRRMERNSLFSIAGHNSSKQTYRRRRRHRQLDYCNTYSKLPPCLEELVVETLTESGGRKFSIEHPDLKLHEEEANIPLLLKRKRFSSCLYSQQHQKLDMLILILTAIGDPRAEYDIGRVLGVGITGLVQAARHKATKVEYAMKTVHLNRAKVYMKIEELKNELETLITLNHPNIVRLFEIYESPDRDRLYIIMELCEGGDLLERLHHVGRFVESEAAVLLRKMIRAVRHCHELGICCRDLCLRHWCFESAGAGAELKLIRFGQSRHFNSGEVMHLPVGTPLTVAPEVLAGEYTCMCDMWSIGVMSFTLLVGHHPFNGRDDFEILEDVKKGEWNWPKNLCITREARDFVSRLLSRVPEDRMTTSEALSHIWLVTHAGNLSRRNTDVNSTTGKWGNNSSEAQEGCGSAHGLYILPPSPSSLVVQSIKQYERAGLLKRLVLHMVSLSMGAKTKALLRSEFEKLDTEGNGFISPYAFRDAVKASGLMQDSDELEKLVEGLGSESGCLRYNDFLAAGSVCGGSNEILDDDVLHAVFAKFDKRQDGMIACEDLGEFLGLDLTPAEVTGMMSEAGLGSKTFLSYNSFVDIVREQVGAVSPTPPDLPNFTNSISL